jgi:hypothetical protein
MGTIEGWYTGQDGINLDARNILHRQKPKQSHVSEKFGIVDISSDYRRM